MVGQGFLDVNILIAPDTFKDCLSAQQVAHHLACGLRHQEKQLGYTLQIRQCPLSDGGEGFVDALAVAIPGKRRQLMVTGPLGKVLKAEYLIADDGHCGYLELAQAAGIQHVPMDQRNAAITSSAGLGEMILDAIHQGCRELVIGLGGSACHDGGAGLFQALGGKLTDRHNLPLARGGVALNQLEQLDLSLFSSQLAGVMIRLATDVNNPLLGDNGATAVFAAQKGANHQCRQQLEAGLGRWAAMLSLLAPTQKGSPLIDLPGVGAAGGAGLPLVALADASIESGFAVLSEKLALSEQICWADVVITGEGCLDSQSAMGKLPGQISLLCEASSTQLVVVAGVIKAPLADRPCYSLQARCHSVEESLSQAAKLLEQIAGELDLASLLSGKKERLPK